MITNSTQSVKDVKKICIFLRQKWLINKQNARLQFLINNGVSDVEILMKMT
jgi:hypothetical protein